MRRTRRPMAASADPTLMVVVVLPTPPFWLATASTCGGTAGVWDAAGGNRWHRDRTRCLAELCTVSPARCTESSGPVRSKGRVRQHHLWTTSQIAAAFHVDHDVLAA